MVRPISGTLPADWKEHVVERVIKLYTGLNETLIPLANILMNSVEMTEKVCDSKFHLGGVISGRLCFTINADLITFGDDTIKAQEVITLDNQSSYTIPLGYWFVDRTDSIIMQNELHFKGDYVCYDCLLNTDVVVTEADAEELETTSGGDSPGNLNLARLAQFSASKCGLTVSASSLTLMSQCENYAKAINGYYADANTWHVQGYLLREAAREGNTYRDVLSAIATLCGGAFKADRTAANTIKLVQLNAGKTPAFTLTPSDRISSTIDTQPGRPIIQTVSFGEHSLDNPYTYSNNTPLDLSLGNNILLPESFDNQTVQIQVLYEIMASLLKLFGGYEGQERHPLVLTTANINTFGDPTMEAGDYIIYQSAPISGFTLNTYFYALEYTYRFRQPSIIRSFADANSQIYNSPSSPEYGETKRSNAYDAATARQISTITKSQTTTTERLTAAETNIQTVETKVTDITTYSETEHLIGTWIDGSDLYEKTIVIPALGDGSTRTVTQAHGISSLGEVVESRGQLLGGNLSRPLQGVPISSDGTSVVAADGAFYTVGKNNITVTSGTTDMSGYKAYVTLRYTKFVLPAWVPAQDDLLELIEEQLPNAGANYTIFIEGGWTAPPIYSESTSTGGVYCEICWSTRGTQQLTYELDSSGNYHYVLFNDPYSGGGGIKGITLLYSYSNPQTGWYRSSTDQDDRFNIVRNNGNGNSKIFSSLILYQKGEGVIVTNSVPDTSGYEFIDMT